MRTDIGFVPGPVLRMVSGMGDNSWLRDSDRQDVQDWLAGRGSLPFTIAAVLVGLVFVVLVVKAALS